MGHKVLSQWGLIHFSQIFGVAFLFFLVTVSNAYSYVEVWNYASFGGGLCGYCGDDWGYTQGDNKSNPTYAN